MAKRYSFSQGAARKVVEATKAYFSEPTDGSGRPLDVVYSRRRDFWAKITDSALISGADNRYQYAWTEQQRTATGFQDLDGGRSGTTETGFAINSVEFSNAATGVMGNSVDHDAADYPPGFSLQAVRGSPVVRMTPEYDSDKNICYTFAYENAEDGPCMAEE